MGSWLNSKYLDKSFKCDDIKYDIKYKINTLKPPEVPKILTASFQPNKNASELTRLFIDSVKKFTDTPYELWIIDDNSPIENLKWMDELEDVNLVFIRTEPKEKGSYSNGIAMEVGSTLIGQDSQYVVTFHSDTAVCRQGWLKFLLSKFDDKTRASGFRLTKERVSEGVLHVCGYLIDFQLYRKLNLSFMPELPAYDIGDKLIHEFLKNGYQIFAAHNTFDDPELIKNIMESLEIRNLNVTRAFNDKNEVIYMHLGRGINKAEGRYKNKEKSSSEQWSEYIRSNLLSEPVLQYIEEGQIYEYDFSDISIRKFYNLNFIRNSLDLLSKGSEILYFGSDDEYWNKNKYIIRHVSSLPADDKIFNCIIYPEIIEYPDNLEDLIKWFYNKLHTGGILILTNPFIFYQEANKHCDFRYSYKWISDQLWKSGFREVKVTQQGSIDAMASILDYEKLSLRSKNLDNKKEIAIKNKFIFKNILSAIRKDNKLASTALTNPGIVTTGFGIKAVK